MAVVEPKPSKADVRQQILKLVVGVVVGVISVGVSADHRGDRHRRIWGH